MIRAHQDRLGNQDDQPQGPGEVAKSDPSRNLVLDECSRRRREQNLATPGGAGNPRCTVNIETDVSVAASYTPPGMDPMRTRTTALSGQFSTESVRWASTAARTASEGVVKTAKKESPSVESASPPAW